MGRRRGKAKLNWVRCLVWLAGICLTMAAYAPIAPLAREWQGEQPEGRGRVFGDFEALPLENESVGDKVLLKNGDLLSGEILRIQDEVVVFKGAMVEAELEVPFGSLQRVEFKKRTGKESEGGDEIVLADGGRFRASIGKMDGENLFFRTGLSDDRILGRDKVASVTLSCEPQVILQEEFTEGAKVSFVTDQGDWVVHNGMFLQSDPNQYESKAHVNVQQWGRLRYGWTMDTTKGRQGGMYILASDPGASREGTGYRVQLEYNRLAVYKFVEQGERNAFTYSFERAKPKTRIEVSYNCETGHMQVWLDGQQVGNMKDKSPVKSGKYIVLRADGRAAFDDVRVDRGGGGEVGLPEGESEKHAVLLKNGDRIVGEAKEVTESEVVVRSRLGEVRVGREKVSGIVLGRRSNDSAKGARVVLRDDCQVGGEIRSLEGNVLLVENETAGRLRLEVSQVVSIAFEE